MLFLLSLISFANDDAFLSAAKEELIRNHEELSLPNQPKPYYIGYHFIRSKSRRCSSLFGALLEQSEAFNGGLCYRSSSTPRPPTRG